MGRDHGHVTPTFKNHLAEITHFHELILVTNEISSWIRENPSAIDHVVIDKRM